MPMYNVSFRGVSSERLGMLIAAGHATPDKGHLSRAEPVIEVIGPDTPAMSAEEERRSCMLILNSVLSDATSDEIKRALLTAMDRIESARNPKF